MAPGHHQPRSDTRALVRVAAAVIATAIAVVMGSVLTSCAPTSPSGTPEPTAGGAFATSRTKPTTPGPSSVPASLPPPFAPAPATWRSCLPEGYQCASIAVPLDYWNPESPKIALAIKRLPATDPAGRIGSVFFNPGGPGASGVLALPSFTEKFAADVLGRFDLVGFDPRGVGGSVPLSCDRAGLEFYQQDLGTSHPGPSVDEAARKWGASCKEQNGNLIPYVGTRDVALDLESLRQAVGDDLLTFAGYSYGTLIGLVYAEMFPTHIRAMILDGVVDPTLSVEDATIAQSVAIERALDQFIAWCPSHPTDCPVAPDAGAALDELYRQARDNPLPGTIANRTMYLGPTLINFAVVAATYDSASRPRLASAIASGLEGDGGQLAELASSYLDAASPSTNMAVNCLDATIPRDAEFQEMLDASATRAPRTGLFNANGARPCEFWPVDSKPLPRSYRATGSAPIMVWGTTGDNATPYENAVHIASILENARLVTLDAERHAAIGANDCVMQLQGAYLVALTLPPPDTRC